MADSLLDVDVVVLDVDVLDVVVVLDVVDVVVLDVVVEVDVVEVVDATQFPAPCDWPGCRWSPPGGVALARPVPNNVIARSAMLPSNRIRLFMQFSWSGGAPQRWPVAEMTLLDTPVVRDSLRETAEGGSC